MWLRAAQTYICETLLGRAANRRLEIGEPGSLLPLASSPCVILHRLSKVKADSAC